MPLAPRDPSTGVQPPRRHVASHALALAAPCLVAVLAPNRALAQAEVPTGFADQLVVGGLSAPVGMASLPDGRLLVIEQGTARVRLIANGALSSVDPVGTIPGVNTSGGERGLLGIAVDPGWPTRPYLYTHSTHVGTTPRIRISRFTASGDLAGNGSTTLTLDPASRYDLLNDIPDNANNHNGGTLRFGPDGMLYVSLGEDAQPCAAQDTSSLRGVVLRLDVTRLPAGPGGPPSPALITPADNPFATVGGTRARLIWLYGLRNPFRFHIDPATGDLFIGDVGQDSWEEIDWAPNGGMNFGWPMYEGFATFLGPGACPTPGSPVAPIYAFDHGAGASVMSAGVYRAPAGAPGGFPAEYEGDYFFSDYYYGDLWRMKRTGGTWSVAPAVPGQPSSQHWATGLDFVPDYLVGPDGALWYCKQSTGQIRRIVFSAVDATPPAAITDLR